ncbi:MAG: hypothetical protein WBH15_03185, partial [Candidatus Methanoculleus thermohydrogenotrophicum]
QSFGVLDPFIQDREGNVSDDRDLFTPGHIGMRNSRFKKVAQRTIVIDRDQNAGVQHYEIGTAISKV